MAVSYTAKSVPAPVGDAAGDYSVDTPPGTDEPTSGPS